MSEKRHATLDAKSTDTFQKRKKAREEKLRMQQQEHRMLNWKKSVSVESLHLIGAAEVSGKPLIIAYVYIDKSWSV